MNDRVSETVRRLIRALMYAVVGVCAFVASAGLACAQTNDLFIHPGQNFQPVIVAVFPFVGEETQTQKLTPVIINNFSRSVFLQPVDPAKLPAVAVNPSAPPPMETVRQAGAQYALTGRVVRGGDGRLQTEFRLWDASTGLQIAGQQYTTDINNARRVAHIVSDAVFSRITGEKGFFDSRIVFVDETGPKERRVKRLALMDVDGFNLRTVAGSKDLVVTPRFSPNGLEVAYMAFGENEPKVYVINLETGQHEVVGNFPGMTFSPRFSPDGQKVLMSLSQGANSNIYVMDLRSRTTTRLTDAVAIDTSPCYSPDQSQIAFESDRGGTQQLYVMSAQGGPAKRISFGAGRYSTPVWSPKGDLIAFTKQDEGQFAIGVMKPDGSGERILVSGFHNEGPSFAPNGLFVMFFRESGGSGGPKLFMIDVFGHQEVPVPTPGYASDPSWGPLLD